jgi:hypothetical protein
LACAPRFGARVLRFGNTVNATGAVSSGTPRAARTTAPETCWSRRASFKRRRGRSPISPRLSASLRRRSAACLALLNTGRQQLDHALAERKLEKEEQAIMQGASWEVALVLDPAQSDRLPDDIFLRTLASSNPQYASWPIWLDSRSFSDERSRPVVRNKGFIQDQSDTMAEPGNPQFRPWNESLLPPLDPATGSNRCRRRRRQLVRSKKGMLGGRRLSVFYVDRRTSYLCN